MSRLRLGIPHTTPTELADRAYQRSRGRPMPIGPAGVPVPADRAVFRPTVDGDLLKQISIVAGQRYAERMLPADARAAAANRLWVDLTDRFPQDEMRVLHKWGCARLLDEAIVDLKFAHAYRVTLPSPVLVPTEGKRIYAIGEKLSTIPLPEGAVPFFLTAQDVEERRRSHFNLSMWPSQFKAREARWPMWDEIAAAWPLIREWFAEQRALLEDGNG